MKRKTALISSVCLAALALFAGCRPLFSPPPAGAGAREPLHLTDAEFEEKVLESELPVMVDIYADWCGPCVQVAPQVAELAGEYEGKAVIAKVNFDENGRIARQYGIGAIPTFLYFHEGKLVGREEGVSPNFKEDARRRLDKLIAAGDPPDEA